MKFSKFLTLFSVVATSLCLASCSDSDDDDNSSVDVREQAVGSYASKMNLYIRVEDKLYSLGDLIPATDLGTTTVAKAGDNALLWKCDDYQVTLSKVKAVSNGLAFDIDDSFKFDGYNVSGYKGAEVSGSNSVTEKYSGLYLTSGGTLTFWLTTDIENFIDADDEDQVAGILAIISSFTSLDDIIKADEDGSIDFLIEIENKKK